MKCVICKHGNTARGTTTLTLERGDATLIVKKVPAELCQNCGEEYVDQSVARELYALMEKAEPTAKQVDVREYVAA